MMTTSTIASVLQQFPLLWPNYGNHRASDNEAREEELASAVIVFIGEKSWRYFKVKTTVHKTEVTLVTE